MKTEAQIELEAAVTSVRVAVMLLKQSQSLMERFQKERDLFDSIGPIIDPTLWNNPKRREVSEQLGALFDRALGLVRSYDAVAAHFVDRP